QAPHEASSFSSHQKPCPFYDKTNRHNLCGAVLGSPPNSTGSSEYLERNGYPDHPDDLNGSHSVVRMLSAKTRKPFPVLLTRGEEQVEVHGFSHLTVNDSLGVTAAGRAGLGLIVGHVHSAADYVTRGALLPVLPHWSNRAASLHGAYPVNRHQTQRVRAFVEWVQTLFVHRLNVDAL
ncbi:MULTISPECIES: LysR substrate-binding domain-containing protein, partial [unclassified Ensifer]|uniref:LysR substrate-binding domain-containing protein n=1 Tax=unclassified Ensifer TaxID=2633371 RepID=UPI000A91033B